MPAGAKHNLINTGDEPLLLYTLYGPPEHREGLLQKTKKDAEEQEEHFDGKDHRVGALGDLGSPPRLMQAKRAGHVAMSNLKKNAARRWGIRLVGLVLVPHLTAGPGEAQTCGGSLIMVDAHERRCIQSGSGEHFRDCADCPEMVVVPAGSFMMGSPPDEPEREAAREEQVRVSIGQPFAIGAYSVTRGEFSAFVQATRYKVDPGCWFWTGTTWEERQDTSWQSPGFAQDDRHPVLCVDLTAAKAYAAWLSTRTGKTYRLPSDAEREYAMRAGTDTPFSWGSSISTDMANYDGRHKYAQGPTGVWRPMTMRVDSFSPNGWGLYQTHGNVWDWTDDCWNESNAGNPGDGTVRSTGDCTWRVARGGAWNYAPAYLRSAYRYWNLPNNRSSVQGFRVVREL